MGLFDRAGLPSEDFRSLGEAIGGRVRVLAWARGADGVVVGKASAFTWLPIAVSALGVAVLGVFPGPVLALATAAGTFIR